jgi:hypothetical protein
MKAKTVNEAQNFERDPNTKKSLRIGKDRFKKPGDGEIGNLFVRHHPEGNRIILVKKETGEEIEVGLFAAKEVIEALKFSYSK